MPLPNAGDQTITHFRGVLGIASQLSHHWRQGYHDYTIEDLMKVADVILLPIRKVIETTGSRIERLLPKSIHAVTAKGFELQVALFVGACSINFLG